MQLKYTCSWVHIFTVCLANNTRYEYLSKELHHSVSHILLVVKTMHRVGQGNGENSWQKRIALLRCLLTLTHSVSVTFVFRAFFSTLKKVKVARTRLPSVRFRSWSRFLAVSLQVTRVINLAVIIIIIVRLLLTHRNMTKTLQGRGRLPLLSARPAVTLETHKRPATNLTAWWTEARRVWTVCLRLLPDSITAVIWTQAILRPSPAC